jgi:hypothetical protein
MRPDTQKRVIICTGSISILSRRQDRYWSGAGRQEGGSRRGCERCARGCCIQCCTPPTEKASERAQIVSQLAEGACRCSLSLSGRGRGAKSGRKSEIDVRARGCAGGFWCVRASRRELLLRLPACWVRIMRVRVACDFLRSTFTKVDYGETNERGVDSTVGARAASIMNARLNAWWERVLHCSLLLFSRAKENARRERWMPGWAERSWRTTRLQRPHQRTKGHGKVNAPATSSSRGLDDTRTRKKISVAPTPLPVNESGGGGVRGWGSNLGGLSVTGAASFKPPQSDALDSLLRN